jgi:hypothetical protein
MKALISPIEPRVSGYRVAQVVDDNAEFGVADPLFWVACSNKVMADQFWYDPTDETIKPTPQDITEE